MTNLFPSRILMRCVAKHWECRYCSLNGSPSLLMLGFLAIHLSMLQGRERAYFLPLSLLYVKSENAHQRSKRHGSPIFQTCIGFYWKGSYRSLYPEWNQHCCICPWCQHQSGHLGPGFLRMETWEMAISTSCKCAGCTYARRLLARVRISPPWNELIVDVYPSMTFLGGGRACL